MIRQPIFLQIKLPAKGGLDDILNRWDKYAKAVLEISHGEVDQIWILSHRLSNSSEILNSKYLKLLELIPARNPLFSLRKTLVNVLENDENREFTLICGDYLICLFLALGIRRKFPVRVKIQIQFHGDFYKFRKRSSLKAYIQNLLGRLAIHLADSIRVVSPVQKGEIKNLIPKCRATIVVCPVPFDTSKISKSMTTSEKYQISFVGRLHEERGVRLLSQIVKRVIEEIENVNIVIAGSGPKETWLKKQFNHIDMMNRIELCGNLTGYELQNLYSESRVLLSTAPYESYGLSIREAALSGIYVVALNNSGVRQARIDFPKLIKVFKTLDEAVELIRELLQQSNPDSHDEALLTQIQKDHENCLNLARSWLYD